GLGRVDDPGVGGHARGNADARERLLDASQVAPAVVDDRDHSTSYGQPGAGGSGLAPGAPPARPPAGRARAPAPGPRPRPATLQPPLRPGHQAPGARAPARGLGPPP